MSPDLERLVPTLVQGGVEFIVIGGVAAIIHGSARATYDVDLLYFRNEANIQRLANLLAPYRRYLREALRRTSHSRGTPNNSQRLELYAHHRIG